MEPRVHAQPTLIIAPAECYSHHTCPEPIVRGGPDIPPENVNRLKVLTDPGSSCADLLVVAISKKA